MCHDSFQRVQHLVQKTIKKWMILKSRAFWNDGVDRIANLFVVEAWEGRKLTLIIITNMWATEHLNLVIFIASLHNINGLILLVSALAGGCSCEFEINSQPAYYHIQGTGKICDNKWSWDYEWTAINPTSKNNDHNFHMLFYEVLIVLIATIL